MASIYMDVGDIGKAQALVDKVLAKDSGNLRARLLKAALLFNDKKLTESAQLLDGVIKDDPRNGQAYYHRGLVYVAAQDTMGAKNAFLKAVEYTSENLPARIRLAEVHLSEGANDLALEQIQTVLARQPDNFRAHFLKGNLYFLERKPDKALESFLRAAEMLHRSRGTDSKKAMSK